MNILVIGNGFDLAHNLPTSYRDCLNTFAMARICIKSCWNSVFKPDNKTEYSELTNKQQQFIGRFYSYLRLKEDDAGVSQYKLFEDCISNNFWIDHFLSIKKESQNQWIDFEREIATVIQVLENAFCKAKEGAKCVDSATKMMLYNIETADKRFAKLRFFLKKHIDDVFPEEKELNPRLGEVRTEVLDDIVDALYNDLCKFTTAVEIYLKECAVDSNETSLECIKEIGNIDRVISFNYTSTFFKYMKDEGKDSKNYCFIHGRLRDCVSDIESPLVLGIDEYLPDVQKDENVQFAMFKKIFQRIYKKTDFNYKNWWDEAVRDAEDPGFKVKLYIFGHSLDKTDKDVLAELIQKEGTKTTIFYRNSQQFSQQLQNLMQVIGIDKLNRRVRSWRPTIVFKMVKS